MFWRPCLDCFALLAMTARGRAPASPASGTEKASHDLHQHGGQVLDQADDHVATDHRADILRHQGRERAHAPRLRGQQVKCQSACKPGSVWRGLAPARDGHSSGTIVTDGLKQPTRVTARKTGPARLPAPRHPYSVLLPVGLAMRPPLLDARCALTAPFHPYPGRIRGGSFSVALSLGSPPPDVIRHRVSMEPGLSSPVKERPSSRLAHGA